MLLENKTVLIMGIEISGVLLGELQGQQQIMEQRYYLHLWERRIEKK